MIFRHFKYILKNKEILTYTICVLNYLTNSGALWNMLVILSLESGRSVDQKLILFQLHAELMTSLDYKSI